MNLESEIAVPCKKVWAMPATNGDTFLCKPIREFIDRHLTLCLDTDQDYVIIDPFARNSKIGNITNDLNPETTADFHMDSVDFLKLLESEGVKADVVIFDPPYSPRQIKELYDGIGLKTDQKMAQRTASWKTEKDIIARILKPKGCVLTFGWNSMGMGKSRGFKQLEILLVCHGAAHNDTICVAEVRI